MVKLMRAFLWQGTGDVKGGACLVASWSAIDRPKELGGLGIPDLTLRGHTLRLGWLWQQRTQPDCLAALHSVKADGALLAFFRASVRIEIGDGLDGLLAQRC